MSKGDFSGLARRKQAVAANAFIEEATADGQPQDKVTAPTLSPRAKKDYKSLRLGFNQYEWELLEQAAIDANLSLSAFIRVSWMTRAKDSN
jgi:methyl coenzyme M reductase alpha subunit